MKNTEIIFVCNSINNKNVRANELKILEKHPEELYFVFGESNENSKKRYYKDLKTLNEDFEKLVKLKEKMSIKEEVKDDDSEKYNFDEPTPKSRFTSRKIEE